MNVIIHDYYSLCTNTLKQIFGCQTHKKTSIYFEIEKAPSAMRGGGIGGRRTNYSKYAAKNRKRDRLKKNRNADYFILFFFFFFFLLRTSCLSDLPSLHPALVATICFLFLPLLPRGLCSLLLAVRVVRGQFL